MKKYKCRVVGNCNTCIYAINHEELDENKNFINIVNCKLFPHNHPFLEEMKEGDEENGYVPILL